MTTHPSPLQLAAYLERLAKKLRHTGGQALDRAELLASRGFPASVGGNGSRTSDTTTSVERAVLVVDQWAHIDTKLKSTLRKAWRENLDLEGVLDLVLAQDSDADILPPGTGYCVCGCEKYCSPKQNGPDDRLRAGLAPSCHRRFLRWREDTGNPIGTVVDYCTTVRRAREKVAEEEKRLALLRAELRR